MIDYHLSKEADGLFDSEIELDESYFVGIREGKRGCGAGSKTAVFAILKLQGKFYTVVVDNTKANSLIPVNKHRIKHDSVVYTNSYQSYNALDASDFKH